MSIVARNRNSYYTAGYILIVFSSQMVDVSKDYCFRDSFMNPIFRVLHSRLTLSQDTLYIHPCSSLLYLVFLLVVFIFSFIRVRTLIIFVFVFSIFIVISLVYLSELYSLENHMNEIYLYYIFIVHLVLYIGV